MKELSGLREQLVKHLRGGEAFIPVDEMLKKISFEKLGERPKDLPYSFYELFHHIYYTQKDILDYCFKKDYTAPEWPQEYWPGNKSPGNHKEWEDLKTAYVTDRERLADFILNADNPLDGSVPSGGEHTFFREILLVIEHTAYHSGQLLIVLRHLGLHNG